MFRPIEGAPGMLRSADGFTINSRDLIPFETSEPFANTSVEIRCRAGESFFLTGWRLTCVDRPSPAQQQQLVTLRVNGMLVAERTVQALLSIPGVTERSRAEEQVRSDCIVREGTLRVELTERSLSQHFEPTSTV